MAATIKIKNSSTAGAAPTSSDLVQGELAVNVTDKRLFTENSGGTVVELGTNPSSITLPDGSASAPTLLHSGDTNTGLFFPAADTVGITTGGTERARVDSSGNMGLGVTPSAWYYPALSLANGSFYSRPDPSSGIASNAYSSTSGGGWKYIASAAATRYEQSAGAHTWSYAASGTAGNAITFTQAMTLDASGQLGIGTSSPSYKLDITGPGTAGGSTLRLNDSSSGANSKHLLLQRSSATASIGIAGALANDPLWLSRSGSYDILIDSSGNLLVGTTSVLQSSQVSISSSGKPLLCQVNAASTTGTPAARFVKYDNNTTTSNKLIDFEINAGSAGSGQINANGANAAAFGSYSDARLKENIVDLSPQLENILALRPAEFDYIESEGGGHQIGFIAQEMQTVYPDVIGEDEDGMLTITGWSKTEARLVKAIQELNAKFEAYKAAHP